MQSMRIRAFLSAIVAGPVATLISIGLLSMMSPAAAHAQSTSDGIFVFQASFPESSVEIRDLSGNVLGEGLHGGMVLCDASECSQSTILARKPLATDGISIWVNIEWNTSGDERAVVGGTGTLSSHGETVAFSFTATFQDNRDGTVSVTYVASRPEASFVIPRAPGSFVIYRRR